MDKARNGPLIALIFGTVIVLVLSVMPTMYAEAKNGSFGGGDGTLADPYVIEDVWDLQNMSLNLSAHYVLGNDIDAFLTRDWNSGAGFMPIGASRPDFTGTLDGRNHTITGLYIGCESNPNNIGLFASVGPGGMVRNVKLAEVNVAGYDSVGGLAGSNDGGAISNCHVTGNVTASWSEAGGLIGYNEGTLDRSHFTGRVQAEYNAGGLVGRHFSGIVNNSYFEGTVTSPVDAGGLVTSYYFRGKIINSHYNINKVTINGGPNVTIGGLFDDQYKDWYTNGLALDISDYRSTLVPSGSWFEVSSLQGWRDLLGFAGVEGLRFRLATDLNLSDAPGLFIPYLVTEFDGANHTVSGLRINSPSTTCTGVFGFNARGTIRYLRVADASVVSCNDAGCLLGRNYFGNVLDSCASGDVVGRAYAGVLVGYNYHGTVSRCLSSGSAWANYNYAGGLSGANDGGLISDCYSSASASSPALVGGLVGANAGTVSNCSATGDASGSKRIGGLIGCQFSGQTSASFATGDVTGDESVGGLIGRAEDNVLNCYALGNVSGTDYVGGLIGEGHSYRTCLTNCYSKGKVSGSSAGGLTGTDCYQVTSCFWDRQTSGQGTSPEGTGKTTAQMKTRATFTDAGWDFSSMWCMLEGVTYPILRWQDKEPPVAEAGVDQVVEIGTEMTFNGSRSTDDLMISRYAWSFTDNDLVNLSSDNPTARYRFDNLGTCEVTLNVTDLLGNWDLDTMNVTVSDLSAPVVRAGPDQMVDEDTAVTFDGSGSSDNVGIADWTWSFVCGGSLQVLDGVMASFIFDDAGEYVITLNCTDGSGNWATDVLIVTVRDTTPPVARAGEDITIDQGQKARFDGSSSYDNVGISSWRWNLTYAGEEQVLLGPVMEFVFLYVGSYDVCLTVVDVSGHSSTDWLVVTVLDTEKPVAIVNHGIGVDQFQTVTFDGSTSHDNVGIDGCVWTFMYGDEPIVLHGLVTSFVFELAGKFTVQMTVSDLAGNSALDLFTVTIYDITSPTANAGPDLTINQTEIIMFDASGSFDDVGIVGYAWYIYFNDHADKRKGPTCDYLFPFAGTYEVWLVVTDEAGNEGRDSCTITVNDIEPPRAEAGEDQSVRKGAMVELDGKGSTDNVGIVNWTWRFEYDGEMCTLYGQKVAYRFDDRGAYDIELTVLDGVGHSSSDDMTIVVLDEKVGSDRGEVIVLFIIIISVVVACFVIFYGVRKR